MAAAVAALMFVLELFVMVLFGRVILDLVLGFAPQWRPRGIVLVIADLVYTVTDPPLRFVRRFIPPLRLGPVSLDLGFLVLVLAVRVVQMVLKAVLV